MTEAAFAAVGGIEGFPGIFLTGGSTKIPYIDNYLASYTGFSFKLSDLYEKATVTGLEKIIRDRDMMKWAQPVKQRKL